MAVPSFMLSFLAARSVTQETQFRQLYAGPWLVWEPGSWQPAAGTITTLVPGATRAPTSGDALCFALGGASVPRHLKVGRGSDCDLIINDATVSRHHVSLHLGPAGLELESMKDAGVVVDGQTVRAGERRVLRWGAALSLGNVHFSLYDDASFARRLRV